MLYRLSATIFGFVVLFSSATSSAHAVRVNTNDPALKLIAGRWGKDVAKGLAQFCTLLDSPIAECVNTLKEKEGAIPAASVCGRQHAIADYFWNFDWQKSREDGVHSHLFSPAYKRAMADKYAIQMTSRWKRTQIGTITKTQIDAKLNAFYTMALAHPKLTGEPPDTTCFKGKEWCVTGNMTPIRNPDFDSSKQTNAASPTITTTIVPASRGEIFEFLNLCIDADAPEI